MTIKDRKGNILLIKILFFIILGVVLIITGCCLRSVEVFNWGGISFVVALIHFVFAIGAEMDYYKDDEKEYIPKRKRKI